ncbi:MAG: YqgE/AlgH family protein [Hyphomicrobiaceae bacterium]
MTDDSDDITPDHGGTETGGTFLDGQLLIAMPAMADERFERAVIYLCAHSEDGAMGIILNKRADHIDFTELLEQLEILGEEGANERPPDVDNVAVHVGGPVESGRGFVLHSTDYYSDNSTMNINDDVSLTATVDILKAIAKGEGPSRAILALGYAGWAAGQLENEIHANGWLNCPANAEIVFSKNLDAKYDEALSSLGVSPAHLVADAGHA